MFSSSLSFYWALVWVLVMGEDGILFFQCVSKVHSYNSRRKTGDNVFLLESYSQCVMCVYTYSQMMYMYCILQYRV